MPNFENSLQPGENRPIAENASAEIPVMMTNEMRRKLSNDHGLKPEQISKLRPEDAWGVLNGEWTAKDILSKREQGEAGEGNDQEGGAELLAEPVPSPKERIGALDEEVDARKREIEDVTGSINQTQEEINALREKMGLLPTEEESPSLVGDRKYLEGLASKQKSTERKREELRVQAELERLIQEEKKRILQERIEALFESFEALSASRPDDFESLLRFGTLPQGRVFEGQLFDDSLEPSMLQSLAEAFREGVKILPDIIRTIPKILEAFDTQLTEEAKKNIEERRGKKQENAEAPPETDSELNTLELSDQQEEGIRTEGLEEAVALEASGELVTAETESPSDVPLSGKSLVSEAGQPDERKS